MDVKLDIFSELTFFVLAWIGAMILIAPVHDG